MNLRTPPGRKNVAIVVSLDSDTAKYGSRAACGTLLSRW